MIFCEGCGVLWRCDVLWYFVKIVVFYGGYVDNAVFCRLQRLWDFLSIMEAMVFSGCRGSDCVLRGVWSFAKALELFFLIFLLRRFVEVVLSVRLVETVTLCRS